MMWYNVNYNEHPLFWEIRMKVREIVAGLNIPATSSVNVVEVAEAIVDNARAKKVVPVRHEYSICDGVLYIDGNAVKRCGPSEYKGFVKNEAAALAAENRILARQEKWMD